MLTAALHVLGFTHARDDRADRWVVQDETQRHLRQRHAGRNQRLQGVHVRDDCLESLGPEMGVTPITFRPFTFQRQRAGQRTLVQGAPRNDGYIPGRAGGEKFVFGILIEKVVHDLHRVNQARLDSAHAVPGLPAIEAEAHGFEQPLSAQVVDLFAQRSSSSQASDQVWN